MCGGAAVHAKKAGQVPKAARMTVVPTATMLETLAEVRFLSRATADEAGWGLYVTDSGFACQAQVQRRPSVRDSDTSSRSGSLSSRRASDAPSAAAIDSLVRRSSKSTPVRRPS
jgi:hypothetical protein